jgi:hypothetical protein
MFRTTAQPAHADDVEPADLDLIPLSVLSLDLEAPSSAGWAAYLTGRGIEVLVDDLGRSAISRVDARQLFDEHREAEARAREVVERQEQAAIERDRAFRAALPTGRHWTDIPAGVSAADVWAQAEKDSRPKRVSVLQEALAGEGMVYRPIRSELDDAS